MFQYSKQKVMGEVNVSDVFTRIFGFSIEAAAKIVHLFTSEPPSVENIQANFTDVEEGDHLLYKNPFGMNVHFYVTSNLGNGRIEVYGRFCQDSDDPFIERKFLFERRSASSLKLQKRVLDIATLEEPDRLKRWLHEDTDIAKEMQQLEEYKTRKRLYGFLNNNSEHFVTFVKTGKAQCKIAVEFKNALYRHIVAQGILAGKVEAFKATEQNSIWSSTIAPLKDLKIIPADKNKIITTAAKNSVKPTTAKTSSCNLVTLLKTAIKIGKLSTIKALLKGLKIIPAEKNKATTAAVEISEKATTPQASSLVTLFEAVERMHIKKIVVVQVTVEGAFYVVSMSMALYNYINGHMSREEFIDYAVKQLTSSLGSVAGGITGSIAGCIVVEYIWGISESVAPINGTTIDAATAFRTFLGIAGGVVSIALGRFTGNLINWLRKDT